MIGHASPLRYPGGKASLAPLFTQIIRQNRLGNCVYAEPYAGGAGAGLTLLFREMVSRIVINDADPRIFDFWSALISRPQEFLALLESTPVSMDEWYRQRTIYRDPSLYSPLHVGFATFYLNRCNRSGIIVNGGPVGGLKQAGKWKIDARFNKKELRERLEKVARYAGRIKVCSLDALDFLELEIAPLAEKESVFVYLDPPYFVKGRMLYLNTYQADDHKELARFITKQHRFKWILSYDNVAAVKRLYPRHKQRALELGYHARHRRQGRELLIHSPKLQLPARWSIKKSG